MTQKLSSVLGKNWIGAVVRVQQSNLDYDARVIGTAEPNSKAVKRPRALTVPVDKPNEKPKWVNPELVTIVKLGGVDL